MSPTGREAGWGTLQQVPGAVSLSTAGLGWWAQVTFPYLLRHLAFPDRTEHTSATSPREVLRQRTGSEHMNQLLCVLKKPAGSEWISEETGKQGWLRLALQANLGCLPSPILVTWAGGHLLSLASHRPGACDGPGNRGFRAFGRRMLRFEVRMGLGTLLIWENSV